MKVLALIPLKLDGFLFSADYQSGKKAEIKSRVAANFVGWEKDHALFDRELEKVIRTLRTDEGGREKSPSPGQGAPTNVAASPTFRTAPATPNTSSAASARSSR